MKHIFVSVTLSLLLTDLSGAQASSPGARPAETYQSAVIGADGSLVITTSDQRIITIAKAGEQKSFAEPVISPDRSAVGAQAEFPNCCTSYDIPLQLVVYSKGKEHRFTGEGLPIFQWQFLDGGARVAFGQEPVHSACVTHYELRDVESEGLLESIDLPQPCGQEPNPPKVEAPQWVAALTAGPQKPHRSE